VPRDAAHDGATDDRAECDSQAGDAAPGADEGTAAIRRHARAQDRERQRRDDRTAHTLSCTSGDQRSGRRRERSRRRRDGEDRETNHEHSAPAEAVAERSSGQQQHREGERVCVDRPLEAREGRMQVLANHRQRRRDHEVVEGGHEDRHRGDCKSPDRSRFGTHGSSFWIALCL